MKSISPKNLKPMLTAEAEIAFLDVREHGQYGEGHPFFSVNVGYSKIEIEAPLLVPRKNVTVVVMDDGDGVSERAAHALRKLGYSDVMVLDGGRQVGLQPATHYSRASMFRQRHLVN